MMNRDKLNALAADLEDVLLRWHGHSEDAETVRRVADELLEATRRPFDWNRWEDDSIQFPRLLAEIMAACELTEHQWDSLLESMDLESGQLAELFDRAQAVWEERKKEVMTQ